MKKHFLPKLISGLLLLGALTPPLLAQPQMPQVAPGKPDPEAVKAATYQVEPYHTQVGFSVNHLGFSIYGGGFSNVSGSLTIDTKSLGSTSVDISVPVDSVKTTSEKLDGELKGDQWLDAGKYPTMHFQSSRVTRTGPTTATIDGNLTLHGVTRPIVLNARFIGTGMNFLDQTDTIGFQATGTVKRSEFGVKGFVPLISDDVTLDINAVFNKKP